VYGALSEQFTVISDAASDCAVVPDVMVLNDMSAAEMEQVATTSIPT
jgi:precorrin-4 methylase